MARRRLHTVLAEFSSRLNDCRHLAADAYRWSSPPSRGRGPAISRVRRDQMAEMAFLTAFFAWESFIEESFVLYLSGQKPPRGRAPGRFAFPPSHDAALRWVVPEGRRYARWTLAAEVSEKAERFFRDGRPFAPVLRGNHAMLEEARIIRNAIVHRSAAARQKFETLVRQKLGTLPLRLTVGGFLGMTSPGSAPPVSFLEYYVGKIDLAGKRIVPS